MDFDNILYILAIAAYILYSIFGKKKAKEKPARQRETRPDPLSRPAADTPSVSPSPTKRQYTPPEPSAEEEKTTEEILKEILTTLGGETLHETGEDEPPLRRKKKPAARPAPKPVKQYETAESAGSLETIGSLETTGSLESFEKPVSYEAIVPETASWVPEKKEIKSMPVKHLIKIEEPSGHETDWREAVIFAEILGKPKAMNDQ